MRKRKTSHNRKVHQRALNHCVRRMNQALIDDDLWQGRFFIRQKQSQFRPYEDGSGADLYIILEMCDRKTGITTTIGNSANHYITWNGSHFFWAMNDFIIENCKVWENEKPYEERYDWIKDKENKDKFDHFGIKRSKRK